MVEINLQEIPEAPGVYLFKKRGKVLYVGKAKNLKSRLSYYARGAGLPPKVYHLLSAAEELQYFLTRNEKEALLLEANLIKKHRPKYNVVFKDDKNYPLLRINLEEDYPRLQIVRRRKKGDKAVYFGPFTSAKGLREILKLISKMYPLRKCSLSEMRRRNSPCIYYQMKKCLAPCVKEVSKEEYRKLVEGVVEFFKGKGEELLVKLKQEMERLAENLEFERAAFLRDRIKDLEKILQNQSIVLPQQIDLDFWVYKKVKEEVFFVVLFVRYGYLYGFQEFRLRQSIEEVDVVQVLVQFYMDGKLIPEVVWIDVEEEKREKLEEILRELNSGHVRVTSEKSQEFLLLRDVANKNLERFVLASLNKESPWLKLKEDMMRVLRLEKEPLWIEAIDLSQFYGDARVGAIVSFYEGEPEKSRYRRYHIKTQAKDDYGMLYEVLFRRLKRGLEEENLPDLLLIDGGKGHLEVGLRVAEDLGIDSVEFRGVAKNEKRIPERLYIPGRKNPILLSRHQELRNFIGRIMGEAHRFAKEFAEKTKTKELKTGILEGIKGIGKKRQEVLLKNFHTLEEILNTPAEEIAKLPGFNFKVAISLKKHLQELLSSQGPLQ